MKKFVLLLLLLSPLTSFAQHDDIYFVPKKVETIVILEDEDPCYEDEYVEEYYTDDSYAYEEDYRYSSRILRFRTPGSIVGSSLYWDLTYNNAINNWVVYDDGYYLDIYPTYTNAYYLSRNIYNPWRWNSWYYPGSYWGYDCWNYNHYYPTYCWGGYYPHHVHGGYRPSYVVHNSWRPAHKVHKGVPVNNGVKRGNNLSTNNNTGRVSAAVRAERGTGRVANGANYGVSNRSNFNTANDKASAVNHRNNNPRSTEVRRQQPQRVANGGSVNKSSSTVRTQQSRRMPTGAVKSQSGNKNSQSGRVSANGERKSQSSSSSNSNNSKNSYRSSSSSSGEYNRPSSTSVARQRSSSSGGHSMSGGARSGAVPRGGSRR